MAPGTLALGGAMCCGIFGTWAKLGLDDAKGFPIMPPGLGLIPARLLNIPIPFDPNKCCDTFGVVEDDGIATCIEGGGIGMFCINCVGGNPISAPAGSFIPHGGGMGGRGGTVIYGLNGPANGPAGSLCACTM